MKPYIFHITLFDLAFLVAIIIGINFSLLLGFSKRAYHSANKYLALALMISVLWTARILAIDIGLAAIFPIWACIPLRFSLALGPLIYFYVLKITRPEFKLCFKDLLHFSPLFLELSVQLAFQQLNPVLSVLAFISVITYLYFSHRLIKRFYQGLKFNEMSDRYHHQLRWLHRLLTVLGLLWLLWIPFTAVYYYYQSGISIYYPLYLLLMGDIIWIAVVAHLRPEAGMKAEALVSRPSSTADLKQKGIWLKRIVKENRYYQDPELSLTSLADKLGLTTHELSRIINTALKKSFNDFINEYRVAEVAQKMQDHAYDHLTLMGIAYDSGFNSQSTFHRAFKELTGKTPAEYKKELPFYNLTHRSRFAAVISRHETTPKWPHDKLNRNYMFRNYLMVAWRNLIKNKALSLINIGGLAVGMAVVMLISLWVLDEVSFDKYHDNYHHIAEVAQNVTNNGEVKTSFQVPYPLAAALRKNYGSDFKSVVMSTLPRDYILGLSDKKLTEQGAFMETGGPDLFTLNMLEGRGDAIKDPSSILISASTAKAFFGNADPMTKVLKMNNQDNLKVAGVYADLPENTTLAGLAFIGCWDRYYTDYRLSEMREPWGPGKVNLYVQLADNADLGKVSLKIRDEQLRHLKPVSAKAKPALFLQPMSKWHLYSEFKDGKNIGGKIQYVWLFGIVGVFVLLLACINFMNLSTARSEKRAREVGIRKAIGSSRSQLIYQFYTESLLCVSLAFLASILLVVLSVPAFDQLTGKQIVIPWNNPAFWLAGIGLSFITAIITGSYPALYLSSFKPVKVLKGVFRVGRLASAPRKVLVVLQFTVSIVLIIGTLVVIRQILFAKDRPVGYIQDRLVAIPVRTYELHQHFDVIKQALASNGTITEMAEADAPPNKVAGTTSGVAWPGEDPHLDASFSQDDISYDYGKTIGWEFSAGRDFSRSFLSDSAAVIINQAAADFMTMKKPTENYITFFGEKFRIIGVTKDIINRSPYGQVQPMVYFLAKWPGGCLLLKISPKMSAGKAISNIASVLKTENPQQPFEYHFVDQEYAKEFGNEERIGTLATAFTGLAIFISCLGLFGMASFMAEQRVKEIGIRKVLGASVFGLWQLLSKDFAILVFVSIIIASPVAYYFMHNWLNKYQYHTDVSWWIFISTAIVTMLITLLTVSFQSIKAALANPIKSLKTE
ncbi:FtsX-like permease family protein [Mucilaginibacter sp. McL0603]|uniref:FtsX-like permease family protein n=1 Tax=Mucilaginibacter sp. McL0603 TaxID=3415670 RepID=UPI003CF63F42